ncbi:MAG: MFS transporter [Bacteroidia bacterium]|nr:MFS transporter [Bacteroidia bacterium]MDW8134898.1 MFS transporter [Bacteroidia bacterium]
MGRKGWLAVLVATLGYFVDIYDLILFSVVREASLKDLGYTTTERLRYGVLLLDLQMMGMLLGGILWGVLADKRGRLSVLFASIVTYSVANFANGLVGSIYGYAVWRFIAGIGLAGELGAGVTLVAELMPPELRGWGTTLIATVGILGAVVASITGDLLSWRNAYFLGGIMGIFLLFLRVSIGESFVYTRLREQANVPMGDFFQLFRRRERFLRYAYAILAGVPIWYVIGILVSFSPELFRDISLQEPVRAGQAVMYTYIGLSVGDLGAGILSQLLKSRKKPVLAWLLFSLLLSILYTSLSFTKKEWVYGFCFMLGIFSGYWAVLITGAAEQFGTNLRATVATSVPNWIRGSLVLSTGLWQFLQTAFSLRTSALLTGVILYGVALLAASQMQETFGKSLEFIEED